ncbi:MAG: 5'/3'-nucleotidase SurE [Thermoleophilia bacterium]|nr:5'/3'-nucleotidase SurE [Thermoleophilia bacterium]
MRILVTNDDGVDAPGILALRRALDPLGEVFVIAPDGNRSAIARGITIRDALIVDEVAMADGTRAFATSGTPVDCVRLGALGLIGAPPDVVVSGANLGLNLGDDVTYSGTVAAALEGVMLGIPAIAVSQDAMGGGSGPDLEYDFAHVCAFAAKLVPLACAARFPRHVIFNVNGPGVAPGEVSGARVTRLGRRIYDDTLTLEGDHGSRKHYRIYGEPMSHDQQPGTDLSAIDENFVSVTPLHFDLTDIAGMDAMERWEIDELLRSGAGVS